MKLLLTLFLITTLFTTIYSDITGVWSSDWQNSKPILRCGPDSFTISTNSSGTYISYNFTNGSITLCKLNITTDFSSVLTYDATNNTWLDSREQELLYDNVTDTIIYPAPPGSFQTQYLYDKNGPYLSQSLFGAVIYGVWGQPARVDSSNTNECSCVPKDMVFDYTDFSDNGFSLAYSYSAGPCGGIDNFSEMDAWIITPSTGSIIWNVTDSSGSEDSVISFNFSGNQILNSFTVTLQPSTKSCIYSFQKTSQLLNGTWQLDAQTSPIDGYPTSIEVTENNNLYMLSTYTFENGTSINGAFSYESSTPNFAAYYDPSLDLVWTYWTANNTITISASNSELTYIASASPSPKNSQLMSFGLALIFCMISMLM